VTSDKTRDEEGVVVATGGFGRATGEPFTLGLPPIRNSYVFFLEVLRGVLIAEPCIKKRDERQKLRSKIAIRCGECKSCEYLRLEICSVLISRDLGRILIPDLRFEIRMLAVTKALERRLWSL
jgi:hypothetical protein